MVVLLRVVRALSVFFVDSPVVDTCCVDARALGGGAVSGDVAFFFAVEALSSERMVRASLGLGGSTSSGFQRQSILLWSVLMSMAIGVLLKRCGAFDELYC